MLSSFRKVSGRLGRYLPAVALLAGAAPYAQAQAWRFDPRLQVDGIYNDNFRLTDQPGQEIEVTGGALDGALTISKQGQASGFSLTPRIRSTYFPGDESEESTDYFVNALGTMQTRRSQSRLDLRFADESVVTSELLASEFPGVNLGETVSGDAGRVSVRNRRRLIVFQPSTRFDWTERRHIELTAHYADASYDDEFFEQVGYSDVGVAGAIEWNVTPRSLFSVGVTGTRFNPDSTSEPTTTTGLHLEWRSSPGELSTVYARIGANHSEQDASGSNPELSSTNYTGGVGVAWNFQLTQVFLDALRSVSPSSAGAIVNRDEVRVRLTRHFTPLVSGFTSLRGVRTDGIDEPVATIRDREYFAGSAGLEWRLTRSVSLMGEYEYKWQKFEIEPQDATSNAFTLSVVYEPRRPE